MTTTALTLQSKQMAVVNDVLKEFKEKGGNIIGNETYLSVPPPVGFVNSYEVVNICPDPKFKEVYPQKGGGLSLTAVGLKKLGKAMGIRFGPGQVVERVKDEQGNTLSIVFRSIACCRGLDGQFSWSQMDYEFDVTKRRQECENTQNKNMRYWMSKAQGAWEKAPPEFKVCKSEDERLAWRDEVVRLEMLQIEKNALTRAQTGSQTRCIRDLGAFPSTYMPQQLQTPFLVPKVVVYFEPDNPMDRAFALEQTKVPMMMYPTDPPKVVNQTQHASPQVQAIEAQRPSEKPQSALLTNLPSEEELKEIDEAMELTYEPDVVQEASMQMTPEEQAMMDYESCDQQERLKAVGEILSRKKWAGKLNKQLEDFSPNELKNFYLMLVKLPTPKESQQGLPWSDTNG